MTAPAAPSALHVGGTRQLPLTPAAPARTTDANSVFKLYAPVARCAKIADVWKVARSRYPHAEIHLSEQTVAELSGIDLGNVVVDASVPNSNLWIKTEGQKT